MKVDNAIILAAGTSSRFAPLSYEIPKGLLEVRGEILIERQIRQLQECKIPEIIIITGYKSEQFHYLEHKFGVTLIHNPNYLIRNNHSSIYAAKNYLKNSYICSSDNYFLHNPFESNVDNSYYSSVYVKGRTAEWCITEENDWITNVHIGGHDAWIMLGHAFWSEAFSKSFISILEKEYHLTETVDKLWESLYIKHIKELPMKIRKYASNFIFEFDTLDELRKFDNSYITDTRSVILKKIAQNLGCTEADIKNIKVLKNKNNTASGFVFTVDKNYKYDYKTQQLEVLSCYS